MAFFKVHRGFRGCTAPALTHTHGVYKFLVYAFQTFAHN